MDITASSMKFVSENISFSGNLVNDLHHCAYDSLEHFDASDIGDHLTKFLNIKEDEESSDEIKPKSYNDDGSENYHCSQSSNLDTEKCLIKFATFPCSSKSTSPSEFIDRKEEQNDDVTADIGVLNDDESSANHQFSHSKSLPTPLKLIISAMKGSREKLGTPPKKLSVKWAPDVYDPIPTSVSHVPKNKPRHRSDGKKKGKNKQKNSAKSSRGNNKGKDKKQVRKYGSSSNSKRDFPSLLDESSSSSSILASSSEVQTSIVDFDIGSPPVVFCGSSFLKKSVPKLHFAVAEAT